MLRPSALMEWERGAIGLVKDGSCGPAAPRPAKPVLEQDAHPRKAPPRRQGGVCERSVFPEQAGIQVLRARA